MAKGKNGNGKRSRGNGSPIRLVHRPNGLKATTSPHPTQRCKTTTNLPENFRQVFEAIGKHANGVPLKDLKVAKLGEKTLHWLVRQLCKHGYVRAQAEKKPEPKKAVAKKEEK
jgi:hypothetical protein